MKMVLHSSMNYIHHIVETILKSWRTLRRQVAAKLAAIRAQVGRISEQLAGHPMWTDVNARYADTMHYAQADNLTSQVIWFHGLLLIGLILVNTYFQAPLVFPSPFGWRVIDLQEGLIVMIIGVLAMLLPLYTYRRIANHYVWRLIVAACLIAFSYLFVFVSGGAIEMHFHFFIILAYMTLYADWRVGWFAFGIIFVVHTALSIFSPNWLYFYGRNDLSPLLHLPFLFVMTMFTTVICRNYRGSVAALDSARQRNDEFLAIASHELKTPLTSIKGYTEVLHRKMKRQSDASSLLYIEKMEDQLERIIGLVRDLLDVTRARLGETEYRREMVSIEALVEEAMDAVDAFRHSHEIQVRGDKRVLVCGDRARLVQLMVNLMTNAIKYSPDADRVVVDIKAARDKVVVEVRDFGMGIPLTDQHKIFEPYFRGRNQQREDVPGGLGMGLYICSEIVRQHHGRMWVDSTVGQGSVFSFLLPLPRPGEEC